MSLRGHVKPGTGGEDSKDPEWRQNMAVVKHSLDVTYANNLRVGGAGKSSVYPRGSLAHYNCERMEIAFTRKSVLNSFAYTPGDTVFKRARRTGGTGLGQSLVSVVSASEQDAITALNGFQLPGNPSLGQFSEEELRLAIRNHFAMAGFVDKKLTIDDAKAGRIMQTIIGGTHQVFSDYAMPLGAIVEVTVPLPSEVASGKFKRVGLEPADKVCGILRPIRSTSFGTEIMVQVNWWLRTPASFTAVMNPKIRETHVWGASLAELCDFVVQNGLTLLDWLQRENAIPFWPLIQPANGGPVRELEEGEIYSRGNTLTNAKSDMFYTAVGFVEGRPATNIAGKMKDLRARLRADPASLAEAFGVATGFVVAPSRGPNIVGAAAAPVAKIDNATLAAYTPAGKGTGSGALSSFLQRVCRSAFWNCEDSTYAFGTHGPTNASRYVHPVTKNLHSDFAGSKIVEKQQDSFSRFAAALSNVWRLQESFQVGRVIKAGDANSVCTINMSKTV